MARRRCGWAAASAVCLAGAPDISALTPEIGDSHFMALDGNDAKRSKLRRQARELGLIDDQHRGFTLPHRDQIRIGGEKVEVAEGACDANSRPNGAHECSASTSMRPKVEASIAEAATITTIASPVSKRARIKAAVAAAPPIRTITPVARITCASSAMSRLWNSGDSAASTIDATPPAHNAGPSSLIVPVRVPCSIAHQIESASSTAM